MTADQYRKLRRSLGTQTDVAELLDVNIRTIQRRESGAIPVTWEAELAILSVSRQKPKPSRRKAG